jgi:hypothetical protein
LYFDNLHTLDIGKFLFLGVVVVIVGILFDLWGYG